MMELPTLRTYSGIVVDIINVTFYLDECARIAQPRWVADVVSIVAFLLLSFNIFVISILICYRTTRLRNAFYKCAAMLFLGEAIIMITSAREGDVQQCVLQNSPARHLAWQTIGTLGMELVVGVNLTLAVTRFATIFFGVQKAEAAAIFGLMVTTVWSVLLTVLHQCGLVTRIWFDDRNQYRDEFLVPFNVIRIPLLAAEISLTFLLYLVTIVKMKMAYTSKGKTAGIRERRFLLQSLVVFLNELAYLYATFWIGYNYFHIGGAGFNANLNYIARPLVPGLTPVLYVVFSSEIRGLVRKSLLIRNGISTVVVAFEHSVSRTKN